VQAAETEPSARKLVNKTRSKAVDLTGSVIAGLRLALVDLNGGKSSFGDVEEVVQE
jgi:hypothetical protein